MENLLTTRGPTGLCGAQVVRSGETLVAELLGLPPHYRGKAVLLPKTWPGKGEHRLMLRALEMLGLDLGERTLAYALWLDTMRGGEACDDCTLLDDGCPIVVVLGSDARKLHENLAFTNHVCGKEWLLVTLNSRPTTRPKQKKSNCGRRGRKGMCRV